MAAIRERRRIRRVASDEAHAWARNLKLGNPLGKLLLLTLSGYVNGEGICWAAQETLAADCDLAVETVRQRLRWLEKVGAVATRPRWVDPSGVRNSAGRGRRTTNDIELMVFADHDEIERLAAMPEKELDAFLAQRPELKTSPPPHGGLEQAAAPALAPQPAPRLAPPLAPHATGGLEPEPEPEGESPIAPEGGESACIDDDVEPEHFAAAWASWPDHQGMRRDLALAEFRKLPPDKQRLCRAAIPQFVQMRNRMGRDHFPNFHIWIRSAGFNEFPTATLDAGAPAPTTTSFDVASREGRAIKALYAFARTSLFERNGRVIYPLPLTARVLAFADPPEPGAWVAIDAPAQLAAWSAFLSAHIHVARPDLGKSYRAPWPWPPRKDGSQSGNGEAA